MESSIPKFENPEALERYLENLKLQLLNAEFAALSKISKESDDNNRELEKVSFLLENLIHF